MDIRGVDQGPGVAEDVQRLQLAADHGPVDRGVVLLVQGVHIGLL